MLTEILNHKTEEKLKSDGTILCHGQTLLSDCNDYVSPSAISLRELMIYADIQNKDTIQDLLIYYGLCLDGDYHSDKITYCIEKLLGQNIVDIVNKVWSSNIPIKFDKLLESLIELVLVKYYKEYTIPTDNYDNIVYEHSSSDNTFEKIQYHQKCLKNPYLKWDEQDNYEYNIKVTYKDIKQLCLQARDSGGHLDCFGYAHDGTTINCVVSYVGDKLGIKYEMGGSIDVFKDVNDTQQKELHQICEDILELVTFYMGNFYITTY